MCAPDLARISFLMFKHGVMKVRVGYLIFSILIDNTTLISFSHGINNQILYHGTQI